MQFTIPGSYVIDRRFIASQLAVIYEASTTREPYQMSLAGDCSWVLDSANNAFVHFGSRESRTLSIEFREGCEPPWKDEFLAYVQRRLGLRRVDK